MLSDEAAQADAAGGPDAVGAVDGAAVEDVECDAGDVSAEDEQPYPAQS